MKHILLAALSLVALQASATVFKRSFAVIYKGDNLGELNLTKEVQGKEIIFTYQMDIETKLLSKDIRIKYDMNCVYKSGVLDHYHIIYKMNNKTVDEVQTEWIMDNYRITSLKKKDFTNYYERINFTTVLLFWDEPGKRSKVWGELNCRYQSLTRTEDEGYAMATGGGRANTFYYENGSCARASFDTAVLDFEIIKI